MADLGADTLGVGQAELGIEGQGVSPVLASLIEIAGRMVGEGDPVVGAGLLIPVSDLGRHGQGIRVVHTALLHTPGHS
jgi:hypothetical protein